MASSTDSIPPLSKTPKTLKAINQSQLPPSDAGSRSDTLHASPIPSHTDPREFYLTKQQEGNSLVPPPLVSCSEFVPRSLVELLMREKKNSALGVKFIGAGGFRTMGRVRLDKITNMEGAMHSFVTPVVGSCEMVGDYRFDLWAGGHGVCLFGDAGQEVHWKDRVRLARTVVLSASIQMDFEDSRVMLRVCKLDNLAVVGSGLGPEWALLSTESKQDDKQRKEYDEGLRRHMIFHLTRKGVLPARRDVHDAMDVESTIEFLNDAITSKDDIDKQMVDKYAELCNDQVVSLELLFNTAVHQTRNEFSALEVMCPQGYVYTYDPASIFAQEIGASILNRLMLAAMRHLSDHNELLNLRVFAFNDYADKASVYLAAKALERQSNVTVTKKEDLFKGPGGKYDIKHFKEAEGALLVVHNNSDGFGQNIETEYECGSLDGAVGSNCSAAASLERERKDLLDFSY